MGVEDRTRHTAIGRMAGASGLLGRGRGFLGGHFEMDYDERREYRRSIEGEDSQAWIAERQGDAKGGRESRGKQAGRKRRRNSGGALALYRAASACWLDPGSTTVETPLPSYFLLLAGWLAGLPGIRLVVLSLLVPRFVFLFASAFTILLALHVYLFAVTLLILDYSVHIIAFCWSNI